MQRYHDYVTMINGGRNILRFGKKLDIKLLAGVPDLQFEVFDDIAKVYDCQNTKTLPLGPGTSHISDATPDFKAKYLLLIVPLLAATDSDARRDQFFGMVTNLRGFSDAPFQGSDVEMTQILKRIVDPGTPGATLQKWMGMKAGKAKYGKIVKSAARFIVDHGGITGPLPRVNRDELQNIFGMGQKTARLFERWMYRGSPDLENSLAMPYWIRPPGGTTYCEIPVDTRILQTCIESASALSIPFSVNHKKKDSVPKTAFKVVTDYVKTGMGFGKTFLDVDYPFWLLARIPRGERLPGCYSRINNLGLICPLSSLQLPRCCKTNCPFLRSDDNGCEPNEPITNVSNAVEPAFPKSKANKPPLVTNKDRVLDCVKAHSGICDGCISEETGISPHQQVNQICKKLLKDGLIIRPTAICDKCGKVRIVNVNK